MSTATATQTTEVRPWTPSERFLRCIPRDFARQHLVLSTGGDDNTEHLVISEQTDPAVPLNIRARLGAAITITSADPELIARAIDDAYASVQHEDTGGADEEACEITDSEIDRLLASAERDLLSTSGKGDVAKLIDALLFDALRHGASDVHIQPLEDKTLVRVRVDGVLRLVRELPSAITGAITSRIKVMGRMDIAERRVPQDGRASVTIGRTAEGGRSIDLRISTLPTSYGERVVIRLLDTDRGLALTDFASLGMPEDIERRYRDRSGRANGIVLLTGPTGSGKTTTLYATLRWIAQRGGGELNVMTIEDPIEYELSTAGVAISQAQVNTKKGVTFASGLRHILRQDPDVVMIGEIRDSDTARIAIQASLTGHLVFSTLHTNDAASAVTRLVDLGVEPYLVGSSLSAVVAQRLARTVHSPCQGQGCDTCLETGYKGRVAVFELLTVDERIRSLITARADTAEIRVAAQRAGMRTLRDEGTRLIEAGITTRAEIDRVTLDLSADVEVSP